LLDLRRKSLCNSSDEKWLICPIWGDASKIASENTGYLPVVAFKWALQTK